tara:strand:+ start:1895 stop:2323 length:429 start_codon:yes stop_codon:yes gene_type:complete
MNIFEKMMFKRNLNNAKEKVFKMLESSPSKELYRALIPLAYEYIILREYDIADEILNKFPKGHLVYLEDAMVDEVSQSVFILVIAYMMEKDPKCDYLKSLTECLRKNPRSFPNDERLNFDLMRSSYYKVFGSLIFSFSIPKE